MITVFYDGSCGLCHRAVQFLLARDNRGARFRYAALQGATAARLIGDVDAHPDSMVVQCADGPSSPKAAPPSTSGVPSARLVAPRDRRRTASDRRPRLAL